MRELNHRSKNIMQSIAATLSLAASRSRNEEARIVLRKTVTRLNNMAETYATLYRSGRNNKVAVRDYLEKLCGSLVGASHGAIRLVVEGDNPEWSEEKMSDLGMLVSEAVSNALHHAFPGERSGIVRIDVGCFARICTLDISDDGVGFDENVAATGIGTTLIHAFARKLMGVVEVKTVVGRGTKVMVTFPMWDDPV
jgi:two-component sensor histidine kinase